MKANALKTSMRGFGDKLPDIRLPATFPAKQPTSFDLKGLWNLNKGIEAPAISDIEMFDLSLGDLMDTVGSGASGGVSAPDVSGLLNKILAQLKASRETKISGPSGFLNIIPGWGGGTKGGGSGSDDEPGADIDTLRQQCGNFDLDTSGNWDSLWSRLQSFSFEQGKARCPELAAVVLANPANKRRICELLDGCLGIACDVNLNIPVAATDGSTETLKVRAVAWIRAVALDGGKCPQSGSMEVGIEYSGVEFKQSFDPDTIPAKHVLPWISPPKLDAAFSINAVLEPASDSCRGVLCDGEQDGPCRAA